MIVQPGKLSDAQRYAIDQFVLGGGRALVFVDPDSDLANANSGYGQQPTVPPSSDLPKLFKAWGIAFDPAKVIADRKLAQQVQVSSDPRNPVASYPIWLQLGPSDFDAERPSDRQPADAQPRHRGRAVPCQGLDHAFHAARDLVRPSLAARRRSRCA